MVVRNMGQSKAAEITLLRLTRDKTTKVAILQLDQSGRFAINTVRDTLTGVHGASVVPASSFLYLECHTANKVLVCN